ncbi:cobalt-zinc-cadmium efflux system outer membrane protein [Chitinophaga dinghuensis]|uniref:Cobalt-zinc-cadmium efflux system outer membrane protein n=1 Tax=Chitinophaga dinghuensis TaxID=1539050 RepID=A0A327W2X1_9BACT|nr:TolC family protein [Chitinophaga dinghuensis]RAJ83631.1 cobalt-zinc-cadmium efflux system outer membrane protein [Chitinophaga dinghuensis]
MRIFIRIISLSVMLCTGIMTVHAQVDTTFPTIRIPLEQYLHQVATKNLGYAAEKYNVSISEAAIESAKVFPDPELSGGLFDNQNRALQLGHGWSAGISTTLELGGKRNARIGLARSEAATSKALLADYYRNLRADATLAYFNAIQQYNLMKVQLDSYHSMKKIADADAIRFKSGAITEIDAKQSNLEAGSMLNDYFAGEAAWKTALAALNNQLGSSRADTLPMPENLPYNMERVFPLPNLIADAQANRADAVAAQNAKLAAEKNLQLVKANRKIDLGINAGIQSNGESTNETAPTPAYKSVNAGISIPLKFSNHYKGELKAARYGIQQAATQEEQVKLQISTEVTQAYFSYINAHKQVKQFQEGLLTAAQQILDGKIYSYKRGDTPLLDVLNAQRTYNDLQQSYYQAMFAYASALVELERSAGIWDIK